MGHYVTIADVSLGIGIHFAYLCYKNENIEKYPKIKKW